MTDVGTPIHEIPTVVRSCVHLDLFNFSLYPPGGWATTSILNHFRDL